MCYVKKHDGLCYVNSISLPHRCAQCGCPGCLSVYNSITTNIYAAEKRIMGRVEAKLQALLEHMDSRFDTLFNSLLLRQEQLFAHSLPGVNNSLPGVNSSLPGVNNSLPGVNNSFPGVRKFSQRNGHRTGDTSV